MTDRGQLLPHPQLHQEASANEISDIYRGRTPSPATITRPLDPDDGVSLRPSLSDSMLRRGRLGALAVVVELAINRWARRNSSASGSSSTSSSSSASSAVTSSRSQRARLRKQRSSVRTLQTVQSEWDIAARIKWIKAREEQRQIPREFTLYLPPSLSTSGRLLHKPMIRRITKTTSLSLILSTLKPTLKPRRLQQQSRVFKDPAHVARHDHTLVDGTIISARFTFSEPTICI
jgi:magnesium transporter